MISIGDNTAVISPCKQYRYHLERRLSPTMGQDKRVCFVMLNPSTADAMADDPTIRKCKGFANRWGMDVLEVVNLFAYRATNPRELRRATDPYGPDNSEHCGEAFHRANRIVVAWGASSMAIYFADDFFRDMIAPYYLDKTWCLGTTQEGYPKHPLYVPYLTALQPFKLTS